MIDKQTILQITSTRLLYRAAETNTVTDMKVQRRYLFVNEACNNLAIIGVYLMKMCL